MTEASPQSSRNAWRERVQALKNVPPVLGILWQSGPAVVVWGLVLRILVAALPAAIAYVAAKIINGVQHVFSHQGMVPHFWWLVVLEAGLNVLSGLLTRGVDYFDSLLADRYTHHVSVRVMRKAAALDVTTYEDPVFYDRLERARVQATDRLAMIQQMGRLIQQIVTTLAFSAVHPALVLAVAGASACSAAFSPPSWAKATSPSSATRRTSARPRPNARWTTCARWAAARKAPRN